MIKIIFTKADGKKYAIDPYRLVELTEAENPAQTWALVSTGTGDPVSQKTVLLNHEIKDIVDTIHKVAIDF
jgi:hypothetical protein